GIKTPDPSPIQSCTMPDQQKSSDHVRLRYGFLDLGWLGCSGLVFCCWAGDLWVVIGVVLSVGVRHRFVSGLVGCPGW
ncbi:hypothetical protein, partial [Streptomyces sp. NPDC006510]|uniref:hypothetical protein n=1 Tax=Streptomyces sp. NPDC006510 TaxID=3155600 RepID=UPI0033ABAFA1